MSSEVNWKFFEKEGCEKVVEEVFCSFWLIIKFIILNSEIEIELENLRNEMKRIKGVNDKLKVKFRILLKKEKVKIDFRDEEISLCDDL